MMTGNVPDKNRHLALVKTENKQADNQDASRRRKAGRILTWLRRAWEFPSQGTFIKDPEEQMRDAGLRYVTRFYLAAGSLGIFIMTPSLFFCTSLKQAVIVWFVCGLPWTYFYFIRWCQRN